MFAKPPFANLNKKQYFCHINRLKSNDSKKNDYARHEAC